MMNTALHFGFWNLRGLNDTLKQKEAKKFINNNKLSLIGLLEHKIKEVNAKRVLNFICPQWHFAHNYDHAPIGRIFVCWDPHKCDVNVLGKSNQHIHCEVHALHSGMRFFTTFVYGANDHVDRQDLWSSMLNLKTVSPWVTLGDFNAIRSLRKKVGGSSNWPPHMDDFNNSLYACELDDLRFLGGSWVAIIPGAIDKMLPITSPPRLIGYW